MSLLLCALIKFIVHVYCRKALNVELFCYFHRNPKSSNKTEQGNKIVRSLAVGGRPVLDIFTGQWPRLKKVLERSRFQSSKHSSVMSSTNTRTFLIGYSMLVLTVKSSHQKYGCLKVQKPHLLPHSMLILLCWPNVLDIGLHNCNIAKLGWSSYFRSCSRISAPSAQMQLETVNNWKKIWKIWNITVLFLFSTK